MSNRLYHSEDTLSAEDVSSHIVIVKISSRKGATYYILEIESCNRGDLTVVMLKL